MIICSVFKLRKLIITCTFLQKWHDCHYWWAVTTASSPWCPFLQAFTAQQLGVLEDNTRMVDEREKEILSIAQSIADLNDIFRELASMVAEQVSPEREAGAHWCVHDLLRYICARYLVYSTQEELLHSLSPSYSTHLSTAFPFILLPTFVFVFHRELFWTGLTTMWKWQQ